MKIKITNKTSAPILTILALILFGATTITAAPGDLDPTFGIGGKLIDGSGYEGYDIAIQPDGKIVVVGSAIGGLICVARYNINGSPDTTFGSLGRVFIDRYQIGVDVAIQADGKIVVAGRNPDGEAFGIFVRLTSNGSPDTSFGTNGILEGLFLPSVAAALPDGKLLIAQAANLFRLNADGSFDSTFSQCQPGVETIHYLYNRSETVIQADGRILTAFTGAVPNNEQRFGVFRCNADGTLDTGFGSGGVVITPVSSGIYVAQSIKIQMDGKIVVAGQSRNNSNSDWKLTVVRYNPNGSLDTGFGSGGIVTTPTGIAHWQTAVSIQTDGKIVASTTSENGSNSDFALVRYNTNGSLDTTFGGGDGITTLDFNQSNDNAHGMTLDSRGRAVVVGGSNGMFAIARFLLAPPSTPFDFDGDGRADISVFRPSDRVWYLNQSTAGFSATQFGLSTDKITPADFDGDGRTDIAVYRDGVWYRLNSTNGTVGIVQFGIAGDIPQSADFTGDGRAELAVYRNGTWWTLNLTNNQVNTNQFGLATDKPVVADYDGDGRADQAIYRGGEWHLNRSTQGYAVVNFGLSTDKPTVGDYDGDGKTDQAVYRDGTWYLLQSSNGYAEFRWGISSDIPAPADYDGDGRTDAAVYRNGVWYLRQTTNGISIQNFGLTNDKPVPAAFVP